MNLIFEQIIEDQLSEHRALLIDIQSIIRFLKKLKKLDQDQMNFLIDFNFKVEKPLPFYSNLRI